jgi:hypothetical protein
MSHFFVDKYVLKSIAFASKISYICSGFNLTDLSQ